MRIAVISDTHIPATSDRLPDLLVKELKKCDMIIHAGDLTELSVLDTLKQIAPTEAVTGNMDTNKASSPLPAKKVIDVSGFKIGIIHGNGAPGNLKEYVDKEFEGQDLDCIIYGHSHIASIEKKGKTIFFKPGSPTDKVFAPYNSFGILEINDKIEPKIVRL
jgi:hypothetical protein